MEVADLIITSNGIKYPTIRFDKALSKKKHYWEKRLARQRLQAKKEIAEDRHHKVLEPRQLPDFKNYQKAKLMVAKYAEKIANQRQNYLHTLSQKFHEKIIHLLGPSPIKVGENYVLNWNINVNGMGSKLVTVNPRKTSQICADCGYDDGKYTLDIR